MIVDLGLLPRPRLASSKPKRFSQGGWASIGMALAPGDFNRCFLFVDTSFVTCSAGRG